MNKSKILLWSAIIIGCIALVAGIVFFFLKENLGGTLLQSGVKQRDFSGTLGEMIPLTTEPEKAAVLVNDSGMSGLEASNHMHNTASANMFIAGTADEAAVTLDAGKVLSLGEMYIWNYNGDGKLDSGMKEVTILYSADGENWTQLGEGNITLAKADEKSNKDYNGILATNINDKNNTPVDFSGAAARYVRIVPVSNWGGDGFGLSEVRLFRHKVRPGKGEMISAGSFAPNNPESNGENVTNGYGLDSVNGVHSKNPAHMWLSGDTAGNSILIIDLDGNYPVSKIEIWNYNDPADLGAGIQEFDLFYTTDSPCEINTRKGIDFNKGKWTKLDTYILNQGTGKDDMAASLAIDIPDDLHIQHLKLVPVNNYAGTDTGFGLSGIRVSAGSGWAVEPARNWTGLFSSSGSFPYQNSEFNANSPIGWIGADGIHAINVESKNNSQMQGSANASTKTLFTFQDTFKGNMYNYAKDTFTSQYGYNLGHHGMINMSYMFLNGSEPDPRNARFVIEGAKDSDKHPLGDIFPEKYWLGDSTVIDGTLYTLASGFEGLTMTKSDFYKVQLDSKTGFPDYKNYVPELIYANNASYQRIGSMTVDFSTVLELTVDNKNYIYTFARNEKGQMLVARILEKDYPSYSNAEYWDGSGWSSDINVLTSKEAAVSTYRPGNEFSVAYLNSGPFKDKFVNVYTEGSIEALVKLAVSDGVTGMFENPADIYFPSEKYKILMNKYDGYEYKNNILFDQWIYNAKAQPAISKEGELLISYHYGAQNVPQINQYGFTSTAIECSHPWFACMYGITE